MAIGAGGAAAVARWRRKRERPSAVPAKATEAASQRTGPQVSREAGEEHGGREARWRESTSRMA